MVAPIKDSHKGTRENGFEPTWEIATLFPNQGQWTELEYLALDTNRLIEFSDGTLEFLSMPKPNHQFILFFLIQLMNDFVKTRNLGYVLPASLRVRLRSGKYREPDIVFVSTENAHRFVEDYCDGADLVVEIVSDSYEDRKRDHVKKKREYAEADIAEYWIVDPRDEEITVFTLLGEQYVEHNKFERGQMLTSVLLDEFTADVSAILDASPFNRPNSK